LKLTQTNSSILQTIRQPTQLKEQDSLAFIYPFIIDKNLDKNYGRLLRDFFTCQFVAQIKTSNVLNIMVKASNASSNNQSIEQVENAAEKTAQTDTLGLLTGANQIPRPNIAGVLTQNYQDQQKYEYAEKINKFREFILDQIRNDPKYAEFNIMVSNITIENLLDLPLIIGTKHYTVNSLPLFWILLAATGQYQEHGETSNSVAVRMDRNESFNYIKRAIRTIDINNYEKLLHIRKLVPPIITTNRIDTLLGNINDELDKAIKTFVNATNEANYSEEIGISQNQSISITNILQASLTTQSNIRSKALTLFSSMIANYIVPIVASTTNAVVVADEVNISSRISNLTNALLTATSNQYTNLNNQITQGLQQETTDQTGNMLEQFTGMCKSNASISVTKILADLSNARFKLTGTRESFINFAESVMKISNQLGVYKSNLEHQLINLSNESDYVKNQLQSFSRVKVGLINKILGGDSTGIISNIFEEYFNKDLNDLANPTRDEDRSKAPLIGRNGENSRLGSMIGGNNNDTKNIVFINNIITAMTNITVFFAYYVFFSYLCEFIQEINATVQTNKKDALEFPNYCLVVNSQVIEAIYTSLAALNYAKNKSSRFVQDNKDNDKVNSDMNNRKLGAYEVASSSNRFSPLGNLKNLQSLKSSPTLSEQEAFNLYTPTVFKITESEIMNMIRTLNDKLHIPNIIVIDEKTSTIYYKWMYSGTTVNKLSLATVQNYVSHQKQALSKL
jgi:hypothetical protein